MLRTLLESQAASNRRAGGTLVSIAVHTAAIALAVVATARATLPTGDPRQDPPQPIYVVHPTTTPRAEPPTSHVDPIARDNFVVRPVIIAPMDVPTHLPDIDLTRAITDEHAFDGAHLAPASPDYGTGKTRFGRDSVLPLTMVEKAAVPRPGNPSPIYPAALRAAQVEGSVVARFIVDTMGRAEPGSIGFLAGTHPLFEEAVRQSLLRSRYLPAMVAGHAVRQLVEQRFEFKLAR